MVNLKIDVLWQQKTTPVGLLSANNRKLKLQFTWTQQKTGKTLSGVMSLDLLRHLDGRDRIWHEQHENMDRSCLVSMVQAASGGEMVWGIISWHTLD